MTQREKAKELFDKYVDYVRMYNDDIPRLDMQKQCALIAVDEIINDVELYSTYWQEVKQEIELL